MRGRNFALLDKEVAAGQITRDEARARFKSQIDGMWFDNHEAYIGAVSLDGKMFANPSLPEIEGKSMAEVPDKIRTAMQTLIDSPQQAQSKGLAGRERAVRDFDWQRKIEQVIDIYRGLLVKKDAAEVLQ